MTGSTGSLKREARILGLDSCNLSANVGAVMRGQLYLDGVVVFPKVNSNSLARRIKGTKYFPELRLIMLHGPNSDLEAHAIHRITGLPVISIKREKSSRGYVGARVESESGSETVIEVDRTNTPTIRSAANAEGIWPEPIRTAHLLAKLHIFRRLLAR